jgi:hypothetical protein
VGYEQIRVTQELSRDVQRSVGVSPRKSLTGRLRALGRADATGRNRRPLAAGSVRTSPRLDLGSIRRW